MNYKACVSGESTKWGGKETLVFKCVPLITRRKGIICAAPLENGSKCLGSPRAGAVSWVLALLPGCWKNDDLGVEDGGQRLCCSSVLSGAAAATRTGACLGLQASSCSSAINRVNPSVQFDFLHLVRIEV